jgi:peptide/nickel transport system substrate-binding protein
MYFCGVKRLVPALLLFVLCGCTTNPGRTAPPPQQPHGFQITYAVGAVAGPAQDVPGAVRGGVITQLSPSDFQSLDPAQMNVDNEFVAGELLFRTLTGTRTTASGDLEVVGDLATDAGRSADNGKTWTYTLRVGV